MARLAVALTALIWCLPARAQVKGDGPAAPDRARAAEAAVVAYARSATPPAAPGKAHDAPLAVRPAAPGTIDRVSVRRTLLVKGPVAAVAFEGGPRDPSAPVEPPAQPLFVGVSLDTGR